ncbi:hypothetical protein [Legionella brunensis]|uniref:Uncharacterized protein n=1 Tax=Legionella brunensis TaxID=29422 RepID=A0A0W0S5L2_9GAMM|nr:hypothetical protein [Legionella brunensis]KTC78395.1 hypothetical protein Lbru_2687 [Legionella brunensis]
MSNTPAESKWHVFKKQSEVGGDDYTAVDNAARIKRLFLDTQKGGPVDTEGELKIQKDNPGPKDTWLEASEDNDEPKHLSKP